MRGKKEEGENREKRRDIQVYLSYYYIFIYFFLFVFQFRAPDIYDMSGECSYTFGSVVRSVGRVRCLKKLWKLEAFSEVSQEWDRYFEVLVSGQASVL